MAGHSTWKTFQGRKGLQDARRSKLFTKIATEIAVAAKLGGTDTECNSDLTRALLKAREAAMPEESIDLAIHKGAGELSSINYAEKSYEGIGPGGVALVVECLTDNLNRTVGDVRHAFTRCGGTLGCEGSVAWMFHKKGQFLFERSRLKSYESLMEAAFAAGAEEVREGDNLCEVTCAPAAFLKVKDALEAGGFSPDVAALTRIPASYAAINSDDIPTLARLIEWLEDHDDVQSVYHNAQLPEA